jgi:ADP-ribose pyrophosphatase
MDNNWKTNSSSTVYETKWLRIVRDEVTAPNGKDAQYDIVERKDVAIVVPKEESSYYMVRQFRYPIGAWSLEFPQGFCEDGENQEEGALRELEEETGLRANKISLLGKLWISSGFSRQRLFVFVAEDFTEGEQHLDDTEAGLKMVKVSRSELLQAISDGSVSNAPTAAALGLHLLGEQK